MTKIIIAKNVVFFKQNYSVPIFVTYSTLWFSISYHQLRGSLVGTPSLKCSSSRCTPSQYTRPPGTAQTQTSQPLPDLREIPAPHNSSASILHAVFERELHGEGKERAYPTLLLDSTILFNTHVTSHLPPDTAEKLEQPSGGLSNPDWLNFTAVINDNTSFFKLSQMLNHSQCQDNKHTLELPRAN